MYSKVIAEKKLNILNLLKFKLCINIGSYKTNIGIILPIGKELWHIF